MKRQTKLYNVILPIWMLVLFPQVWVVSVPLSLAIDYLVLYLTLRRMKHPKRSAVMEELWWKFWLLGFAADAVGVLCMFVITGGEIGAEWLNPLRHINVFLWTLVVVAIAGVCVYFFDRRAMKKCALLTDAEKHRIALAMAIFTAPWLFFIPMYW